jgi:hypothetical protein
LVGCEKRSAKKNGPVVTRPFGREARIVALANARLQYSGHQMIKFPAPIG